MAIVMTGTDPALPPAGQPPAEQPPAGQPPAEQQSGAASPGKPARSIPKALLLAGICLYLPTAIPFATVPLSTSSSATAAYLEFVPVLPGLFLSSLTIGTLTASPALPHYAAAAAVTALLGFAAFAAARRLAGRDVFAVHLVLMALIGLQSHMLAAGVRA